MLVGLVPREMADSGLGVNDENGVIERVISYSITSVPGMVFRKIGIEKKNRFAKEITIAPINKVERDGDPSSCTHFTLAQVDAPYTKNIKEFVFLSPLDSEDTFFRYRNELLGGWRGCTLIEGSRCRIGKQVLHLFHKERFELPNLYGKIKNYWAYYFRLRYPLVPAVRLSIESRRRKYRFPNEDLCYKIHHADAPEAKFWFFE